MSGQKRDWSLALRQSPGNIQLLIEAAKYFIGNEQAGVFLSIFDDIYSDRYRKTLPPQIIFSVGQTALQEQRWDLASNLFYVLRKNDPTSPALIAPLSEALLREGRLNDAVDVLKKPYQSNPQKIPRFLPILPLCRRNKVSTNKQK